MRKALLKSVFVVGALFAGSLVANAQFGGVNLPVSFSGQLGYASPTGSFFETEDGERMTRFGISVDADVLWHFEQLDYRLGVGLTYNVSVLFGADLEGFSGGGLYTLNLYGVKAQYRFFNSRVSPYASLSLGLSQFSTPEWRIDDEVIVPAEHAFGFGIRPEIGVEFGAFVMSVGYMVPMGFKFDGMEESLSAGSWQFSIGTRISLFDRDNRRRPPPRRR